MDCVGKVLLIKVAEPLTKEQDSYRRCEHPLWRYLSVMIVNVNIVRTKHVKQHMLDAYNFVLVVCPRIVKRSSINTEKDEKS